MDTTLDYHCPFCVSVLSVAPRAAGKILPCPHCGQRATVPTPTAPTLTQERLSPTAFEGITESSGTSCSERPGEEPWYFGMARLCAWLLVAIASVVLVFVPGYIFTAGIIAPRNWTLLGAITAFTLYFLPIAFGLLVAASLIFLAVDMAQSLRVLRRRRS